MTSPPHRSGVNALPTYEYRCDTCGQQFEVVQSFKDRPLRRHRECGGPLEKVFHPRGVVFKGSGFYVTDSRAKAESTTGNGGSGGESASNGESKPAKAGKEKTSSATEAKASKSASSES